MIVAPPLGWRGVGRSAALPTLPGRAPVGTVKESVSDLVRQATMSKATKKTFEYVEPIGARILVRKDEPKRQTKGGIALPDQAEIPTITGRIVAISTQVENDEDVPLRQYDRILFHPKNAIPVDFESDNQLYVVPVEDVVAVFRRQAAERTPPAAEDEV
jgi:chaperonin GroES